MEPDISPGGVILVMLLSFAAGCLAGADSGRCKEHTSAVKAGVGEYAIDSATGLRSFVWKVCK